MVGFYDKISPKNSDIESEYYSFSFASYRVVLVLDGIIGIKGLYHMVRRVMRMRRRILIMK